MELVTKVFFVSSILPSTILNWEALRREEEHLSLLVLAKIKSLYYICAGRATLIHSAGAKNIPSDDDATGPLTRNPEKSPL